MGKKMKKPEAEQQRITIDDLKGPFREMVEKWSSSMVGRTEVPNFSGGLRSGKTYANLNSQGKGPKPIRIGRKIGYRAVDLAFDLQQASN